MKIQNPNRRQSLKLANLQLKTHNETKSMSILAKVYSL